MFRIGEFSKIAQVSGRLLRYYDEIGLLKPQHIDKWTGYRYYTAEQLPRLNRILALKELGLSLEQIQQLLDEAIDTDGIRSLYLERKVQIERALRDELTRLQQVRLRLNQLDSLDENWLPDVVVKQVPAQPVLAYRDAKMSEERLYELFDLLSQNMTRSTVDKSKYGALFTVLYSDMFIPDANMDMAIGFVLNDKRAKPLSIEPDIALTVQELPAAAQMATIVHRGLDDHPITYNALGRWLEQNQYCIVGHGRELLLENHYPAEPDKCIVEIQFPVERVDLAAFDFSVSNR